MSPNPKKKGMKFDTKEPCGSCPYRRDSKLGLWSPAEFENLQDSERSQMGKVFGCHATIKQDPPSVCAGWLLDQRERGVRSLSLRMYLMANPEAIACMEQVTDGGHELYESIEDMVQANEELGRCYNCDRYLNEDGHCPVCES